MRRCARCGEEKPTSEFHWKDKKRGWLRSYCKLCASAYSREHYEANKRTYITRARRRTVRQRANRLSFLIHYLESHPCVDCGESDPMVLEFDHLRDKTFNIGHEFIWKPWDVLLAEIEKCEVRCANCHRRRTAERAGYLRLVLGER